MYSGFTMSFCDHCEGQRFDRAQVLRTLRQVRKQMCGVRRGEKTAAALDAAIRAVRALDIPHLDVEEPADHIIH